LLPGSNALQSGTMRFVGLGAVLLCLTAAAQVPPQITAPGQAAESPAPEPNPGLLLQNTGKPMVVEYHCSDEDIQTAGLSCTVDDPCPLYLELSAVEAVGNRVFVAGNIHSPSTTLYSILLASDDSGKTWREPHERLRNAGLDRIQFVDFENGWISGAVLSPLPRDPFLLITSDAGKAWRFHPIFQESRFGSITQFWFSSRTAGSMLIDRGDSEDSGRYELYETPNAGETWMLRAVNERPVPIKHGRDAGNTDWRIRPDGATKSYRVEHHVGERWHSIAGFSVAIGMCKPPAITAPAVEVAAPGPGVAPDPRKTALPER
jgi:photosystem II stability/assembly factor-like uncharacterized protein